MTEAIATQRSLLSRVMIAVFAVLTIGGIIVALASWSYGRAAARQAYDRLLVGAAQDIAESINVIDGAPLADLPVSAFALLGLASNDRITYAVRGPSGNLLTGHNTARIPEGRHRPGSDTFFYDERMQGEPARFVAVVRRFAERNFSGNVSVIVGQTLQARNAMAFDLASRAMTAAAFAGVALILIAFLVVRSAMRPLGRIADELSARDPYDLTPMETNVPAEVGVMLVALNRFMLRLERQVDSMRHLISDTAHQLRTPVAAIRAQAELALEQEPPERQAQRLQHLLRRTRSLGDLLDQILSRALVIHRTDNAPPVPVDLRDIALAVVEERDHELIAPGIEVELVIGPDPVVVMADEISLGEAAKNLLVNAMRHGKPPIRIGVSLDGITASLWVEDAGTGPSSDVLSRLGKRFERSVVSGGTGLGLSIAQSVAEAFAGRLHFDRTSRGFCAAIELPVSGESAT
ncbi:sensor histidine kinase [Sedimentitalea nanhaiensis]|uniref:histidine kinase n=1 Tax=Sedimentitalea nanhaiensis TaxID=999627 RepID=A0A1I7E5K7_9RHOB|nr:sensor histidine kinase N-terminal domain-containing protein [Sedimentitalea nanhaiensis]SFU19216.1 two-component system, OmpR family, sensor histidine kinase TctE [Sedimentitalea nanhaiensis]